MSGDMSARTVKVEKRKKQIMLKMRNENTSESYFDGKIQGKKEFQQKTTVGTMVYE